MDSSFKMTTKRRKIDNSSVCFSLEKELVLTMQRALDKMDAAFGISTKELKPRFKRSKNQPPGILSCDIGYQLYYQKLKSLNQGELSRKFSTLLETIKQLLQYFSMELDSNLELKQRIVNVFCDDTHRLLVEYRELAIVNQLKEVDIDLEIMYQDEFLAVVNKKNNFLTVQGSQEKDCLESRLREKYPQLRIVHRLDYETSGLVVVALTKLASSYLGKQFQNRTVKKRYVAECQGIFENDEGEVNLPLIADKNDRLRQIVDQVHGKASKTMYRVLVRKENITRLHLFPHTGRTHQLRVHMKELGHPILGDSLYNQQPFETTDRLLLHADSIEFIHPNTKQLVQFQAPCPF